MATNDKRKEPVRARTGRKATSTRLRLLDSAAQVLSQTGYAGMRLSDVGDVAGVQASAIYYHFASKEQLAGEVLREGLVHAREYLTESLGACEGDDPLRRLGVAIEAFLRVAIIKPDYSAAASLRSSGELPASVLELCRPEERAFARVWRRLLTDADQAGLLREHVEVGPAQVLLIGALNAVTVSGALATAAGADRAILVARQVLLNGLSAVELS